MNNLLVFSVSIASIVVIYLLVAWAIGHKKTNRCPSLKCWNDSVPTQDCTSCICKNKWQGTDCNMCYSFCKNGGVMTPACEDCFCKGGWKGQDCSVCPLVCEAHQQINADCTSCVPK